MAGSYERDRGALRGLRDDLSPGRSDPLFTPPLPAFPSIAWSVHLAVGCFSLLLAIVSWHTLIEDYGIRNETAGLLAVAQALGPLLCLYWPMSGWWLSLGVGMVAAFAAHPMTGVVWPVPVLAVHLLVLALAGLRVRPRVLAEMWVVTMLTGLVPMLLSPGPMFPPAFADMAVLSGAVLVAAGALRGRGEALRSLARAERLGAEEQARRALLEERARIARELHDVVAHHMAVVAVQAEAAPYRVDDPPEELSRSFATIRASALEALAELHRVLGLLRNAGGEPDLGPQPGLSALDGLVAKVREAGLRVTLETAGTPRPAPPGVGLSAYRIVQEALSNVMRHAPGADVRVELAYTPDGLEVRVRNGPAPAAVAAASSPGHGLLGMRERAAMLGGRLDAGPGDDGGYAVTARLPLDGDGIA
ncbi:sensor histidine kinase [Sphaerisporangium sp. TRM90804]|uniref:sensor histidine kinase n=1 Tax=Sphaerisporangium sp. TRM90804 TaxID=3031113 RepID=UPI0024491316|nr:sensor histidine kinase [Sphaerisporangium sp. TRM90804]MDH2430742.1 sensor histidine kinase [Sphaerisporangium sp. TRM90804]